MNDTLRAASVMHPAKTFEQIEASKQITREESLFEPFWTSQRVAFKANAWQVHLNTEFFPQIPRRDVLMFGPGPHAKPGAPRIQRNINISSDHCFPGPLSQL